MSLRVIGLISGGKDSFYSLAHCNQNGHKVVALANLHPQYEEDYDGKSEGADLDSFMYQTVGHTIIPLYADALGLPLYRRAITGSANQKGRYYDTSNKEGSTDEIEDMFLLVQDVLSHHPEANALSAGAILSTYQRTRVESVAVRLGLTPLAYLWQYPALPPPITREDSLTGLLDDMSVASCDARIIKIASGGVRHSLLSMNIADPEARASLVSGSAPFFAEQGQEFWLRGAVLGEGGEYETLALDGPAMLWRKRINLEFSGSYQGEGGSTYSSLGVASTLTKNVSHQEEIHVPVLLDTRFTEVQSRAHEELLRPHKHSKRATSAAPTNRRTSSSVLTSAQTLHISNIVSPSRDQSPAQQLEEIIDAIPNIISKHAGSFNEDPALRLRNIASTTLVLRSIDDFAILNPIYAKLWPVGLPNPPARVTIAAPLSHGVDVSLSLTLDLSDTPSEVRTGLHVQSRSYWAPANIGPYSQAISTPVMVPGQILRTPHQDQALQNTPLEIIYMAGQIPLVPASMIMLERPFVEQAVLAIQHLWRVGQERRVDLWCSAGLAFLVDGDTGTTNHEGKVDEMLRRVRCAAQVWRLAHQVDEQGTFHDSRMASEGGGKDEVEDEDDSDVDVWDIQQQYRGFGSFNTTKTTVGEHLHALPNRNLVEAVNDGTSHFSCVGSPNNVAEFDRSDIAIPTFIAAQVSGLPRNAPIEWWSNGVAGLSSTIGKQQSKVYQIERHFSPVVSMNGLIIEHYPTTIEDEDEPRDTTSSHSLPPVGFTTFLSIVVRAEGNHPAAFKFPRQLDVDTIAKLLVAEASSMTFKTVTAYSYLNLSYSNEQPILHKLDLVRESTVVPCYHVWASIGVDDEAGPKETEGLRTTVEERSAGMSMDDGNGARTGDDISRDDPDAVEEVAAAILLRLEAF